jgi:hypothetical protein
MTIQESIKAQIEASFRYTTFPSRSSEDIGKVLSKKVAGSDTIGLVPEFDSIKVERSDVTTDKVTLVWENLEVQAAFVWKVSDYPQGWKLMSVS